LYMRSSHLDDLVTFVVESSTKQTQNAFQARNKKFWQRLMTMGVNVDYAGEEDVINEEDIECSQDV
jgi:hypothetical protein